MLRGREIILYPTKEQEKLMEKHSNSCRFIWNYMLTEQKKLFEQDGKYLSTFDMIRLLKPLKEQEGFRWLYEVSNASLQIICRDLNKSYQKFFKKKGNLPKFKTKKESKHKFPTRSDSVYFLNEKYINIEKIGKVKYKTNYVFKYGKKSEKFLNARISYKNGKWILGFVVDCDNQTPALTNKSMGIDLGIKSLAVVEYNNEQIIFGNINKSKKVRLIKNKILHLQRIISRKYEANKVGNKFVKTNNIIKYEEKVRKLFSKLTNIRKNYIHQTTHTLVSLLPCRIVMENLNVIGMMKNRYLAKSIQEQWFAEFIKQIEYKCEWNNIEFIKADRFYPSSKTCSNCGSIKKLLKLDDRIFVCDDCGFVIDRDYNAAINLSRYKV